MKYLALVPFGTVFYRRSVQPAALLQTLGNIRLRTHSTWSSLLFKEEKQSKAHATEHKVSDEKILVVRQNGKY